MQAYSHPFDFPVRQNVSLAAYTTFRVGGPCDYAAFPKTENELASIIRTAKNAAIPFLIVGAGSNLLFDDKGYRGLVIFTSELKTIVWGENEVTAGAGVSVTHLSMECSKRGMGGFSAACGIPGSVGGAVYMNAGAFGFSISDILSSSRYFDGQDFRSRKKEEHDFDYRESIYRKTKEPIVSATFRLTEGNFQELVAACKACIQKRKDTQPLEYPSAGSTFKRPVGHFAGALIEQAGLKGTRIGGAEVSTKHAGFLINRGGATATDILKLMELVENTVYQKFGVFLEPEIVYIKEK